MSNRYSVALCTYNGEEYVIEQLQSILGQTIPPAQIVVSDDGSQDSTLELVDEFLKDKDVSYILTKNSGKHGVSSNFMNALHLCTEEIIFTSDQDDIWKRNKAEVILNIYKNNSKALLVFSNGELVDSSLKPLGCDIWKAVGITAEKCKEGDWFHYLLKSCLVTGATMAFKQSLVKDVTDIPKEWLHDGWFSWLAVSQNGLVPCAEKLILYRQHSSNVVGMKPKFNIYSRFREWYANFSNIFTSHQKRYFRTLSLYQNIGSRFNPKQQNDLQECVAFWGKLSHLLEERKISRVIYVLQSYKDGYYDKFYTGLRGAIRDIVVSLKL